MIPTGKGMYLWQLWRLEGSTAADIKYDEIVQVAVDAGITHVYIKAASGTYPYNVRWENYPYWSGKILEDYVVKIAKKFESAGIEVIPWHYIYGYRSLDEARMSVKRVDDLGSKIFVIDAEAHHKHKPEEASLYVSGLLVEMKQDVQIGLTSYRFPESHPEFPWHEFLGICDFVNQQVYWEQVHNPIYQLDRSIAQYDRLLKEVGKDIPQIPIGAAYSERGWQATEKDVQLFLERCVEIGFPSISFWSWDSMRARNDPIGMKLWDVIASFEWKEPGPIPFEKLPDKEKWEIVGYDLRNRGVINAP